MTINQRARKSNAMERNYPVKILYEELHENDAREEDECECKKPHSGLHI